MKTVMIILIMSILATAGFAQGESKGKHISPEEAAKKRTEHMLQQGLIDEDQKEAVYAIHLDEAKKRSALREQERATMAPFKEERKAIRSESDERLSDVLSEEQMQKITEKREARQKKTKDFRQHRKDSHMKGDGHRQGRHEGIKKSENE